MKCEEFDSPAFITNLHNAPYSSSLATSASASSASVWSDASSQSSDDTSISAPASDSEHLDLYLPPFVPESSYEQSNRLGNLWSKQQTQSLQVETVPLELRQNPRRSSTSSTSRSGCPPTLIRQGDRKVNFVDNLVDSSTQIVEAIWPTSSVVCRTEIGNNCVLPLRTFIQETLRRSKTSYSTLQVALYYLVLIRPHVPDHDFTMEQLDDCHASRALQCGRRMFLAALILASKYLQDRNYSARAWSKISGLATQEINQNEMAFLIAVNWKLHITNEIYRRWTEGVMKFSPSQPPSPGSCTSQRQLERQCEEFKNLVLKLTPELDNLEILLPCTPVSSKSSDFPAVSPRTPFTAQPERSCGFGYESADVTPTPKSYGTPSIMEPAPATVYTPGRLAPALGLLPTPRLTPQTGGFGTPAVSAVSHLLGKGSMGLAMAQASTTNAVQNLDRWPISTTCSPQSYFLTRRSSLANSVSTASSPESMVSDSSRTSRSSSISSASSLVSAPSAKLDVQARCRYAKQCSERYGLRPTIPSVPEDYEGHCFTSSPESYTGPMGKDIGDMSLETPLARRECEMDDNDAARALQDLHNYHRTAPSRQPLAVPRAGLKRSRPLSVDHSLQDNVREMLNGRFQSESSWANSLVRPHTGARFVSTQLPVPVHATLDGGRKRVCCSTEAIEPYAMSMLHPAMGGMGGPGMWEGILN